MSLVLDNHIKHYLNTFVLISEQLNRSTHVLSSCHSLKGVLYLSISPYLIILLLQSVFLLFLDNLQYDPILDIA
jgi:hypothetical protein